VLWSEPKNVNNAKSKGNSETSSLTVRKDKSGKDMFAKVRRFVIIKPMEGHCICLSEFPPPENRKLHLTYLQIDRS
jgi:hypothetical protein